VFPHPGIGGALWAAALAPVAAAVVLAVLLALAGGLTPAQRDARMEAVIALGLLGLVSASLGWRLERAARVLAGVRAETDAQDRQLRALSAAALALSSDFDLTSVLQRVVDLSRQVIGARYGALAVLGPGGTIADFITSGIAPEVRARLGPPPTGHGVLGVVIDDRRTLRLDDLQRHPRSVGFPEGHPPMKTLLAVPLTFEGDAIGSLYLSERDDGLPFSAADEDTLVRFAAHAAAAVANARLYQRIQRLTVIEERQRIAMDLHDGVLQSIFGISLGLESGLLRDANDPATAALRADVEQAVQGLAGVARDIRSYVQDLRRAAAQEEGLVPLMQQLLDSLETGPEVHKELLVGGDDLTVSQPCQWALWHVAHEALSNAVRHGGARRIDVHLARDGEWIRCAVQDDGCGFDSQVAPGEGHNGLGNMRRRLEAVGGRLTILSAPGRGTTIIAEVPA
jgi:signal transduction histidine kinase